MTEPRIIATETLHDGWLKLLKTTIRTGTGSVAVREVVGRGPAAAVLPFDRGRGTALLVRQFRAAVLHCGGPHLVLEAIAGVLDEDDPQACARREAMEEAGLRLGEVEPVGTVFSSPGFTTERVHLFLAPYGPEDRVAAGGGVAAEHEDIEVVELTLRDLWERVRRDEIIDLKTLCLVQALRLREPDAFACR